MPLTTEYYQRNRQTMCLK